MATETGQSVTTEPTNEPAPDIDLSIGDFDSQLGIDMLAGLGDAGGDNTEQLGFPADPDAPQTTAPQMTAPAATSPASDPPPAQELEGLRGYLKQNNFDVDGYETDEAALDELRRLHNHRQQLEQYAQVGMQYAPYQDQFNEFLQKQSAQQQAPQTEGTEEPKENPFDKHWDAPKFNPDWMKLVTFDDKTGAYVPVAPGVSPEVVQGVNDAVEFLQNKQRDFFLNNPIEQIWKAQQEPLQDLITQKAKEIYQEQKAAEQREQSLVSFERDNSAWMYERSQDGQIVNNPQTGQPNLTPAGARFYNLFQNSKAKFPGADPLQLVHHVRNLVQGELAQVHLQAVQAHAAQQAMAAPPATEAPAATPMQDPAQQAASRISQAVTNGNSQAAFHQPSANGAYSMPADSVPVARFSDLDDWFATASRKGLGLD